MTTPTIDIHFDEKKEQLGDLYGLFFEDLNHAADGGLYAELIENRSFEFCSIDHPTYHALTGWQKEDGTPLEKIPLTLRVMTDEPLHPNNSHYLKINTNAELAIYNAGFNQGLYLEEGASYRISFFAKADLHDQAVTLALLSEQTLLVSAAISLEKDGWQAYEVEVTAPMTTRHGRLGVFFPAGTALAIDMISVFPKATFKGRKNGVRQDLAELLAATHPKFLRFPGGCLVHDGSLNSHDRDASYRWKNTLGPIETRPTKRNSWGYNQTLGLGYFEYFQLCEDLGAKPLPVLPAGFDPHHQRAVPLAELQPWIDDALDLIEFANGPKTSPWGQIRCEMGHPEPFGLEYLAIGNEEVGQAFFDRYAYFHEAIRANYPDIKLINSAGPFSAGSEYERGWQSAKEHGSDLIDEHYYCAPEWFLANHHHYDVLDPTGPKVFLGEYAAKTNRWKSALAEASYMIGLEHNAEKVALACYAPLFANDRHVNWAPDMIWFDQEKALGSVNYEVQKLFMTHLGTQNVGYELQNFPTDRVVDDAAITGSFGMQADGADISVTNIHLTDQTSGQKHSYPDQAIRAFDQIELDQITSSHYTLSFDFEKTGGKWDKGFKWYFGKCDEQNLYHWALGGWQNQDCLLDQVIAGADSVLTQSIWRVTSDHTYHCRLEVAGRRLKTFVDGKLMNQIEVQPLVIQRAYVNVTYAAAKEVYYLKVVNYEATDFTLNFTKAVEISRLTQLSADIEAENHLGQPSELKRREQVAFRTPAIAIKKHSVTVVEIKNKE